MLFFSEFSEKSLRDLTCGWIIGKSTYPFGAVAQLGARLHGMQKVRGSNPRSSIIERVCQKTTGPLFYCQLATKPRDTSTLSPRPSACKIPIISLPMPAIAYNCQSKTEFRAHFGAHRTQPRKWAPPETGGKPSCDTQFSGLSKRRKTREYISKNPNFS